MKRMQQDLLNSVSCAAALFCLPIHPAIGSTAGQDIITIENCSLFDSVLGRVHSNQTVVIRGDRVVFVGPVNRARRSNKASFVIDGRGKFLIPGLIDAHVHLMHVLDFAKVSGDEVLPLYLAAGVTSVRSTGDELVEAIRLAQFAKSHSSSCPRVFPCSPLLDADPPIHRDVGRGVTSIPQIPPIFDELVKSRVKTVKIYAGTDPTIGKAIIDEAHKRKLVVTGHLGNYAAQQAVADGIDCLEHIWSVFNFVIPKEVVNIPGHRGNLDLSNPLCDNLIADLVKHKTIVDPTLSVFRNMILLPDIPEVRDSLDNTYAPKRLREFWPKYLKQSGCPQGGTLDERRREFSKFQELTVKLFRAGVPILVGTDSPEPHVTPGFSLHTELELLVASGMPPSAVLQSATYRNACVLREEKRLGSIARGKLADMVLLSEDPTKDIRNTRSVELIIRGGKVVRPRDVLQLVPKE